MLTGVAAQGDGAHGLIASIEKYIAISDASKAPSSLFKSKEGDGDRLLDSAFRLFATTNGVSARALVDMLSDDTQPESTRVKAAVLLFDQYAPRPSALGSASDSGDWLRCLSLLHARDFFRRSHHGADGIHNLMTFTLQSMQWPPPEDAQQCLVNWLRNCHQFFQQGGATTDMGSGGLPVLPKDVIAHAKAIYYLDPMIVCSRCRASAASLELCRSFLDRSELMYTNTSSVEKVMRKLLQQSCRNSGSSSMACSCRAGAGSAASGAWRAAVSSYATMQYEAFSIDAVGAYRGVFTCELRSLPLRRVLTFLLSASGNRAAARLLPAFIDLLLYLCPDALLDAEVLGVAPVPAEAPEEGQTTPSDCISDSLLPRMLALSRGDDSGCYHELWRTWHTLVSKHHTPQALMLLTANILLRWPAKGTSCHAAPVAVPSFDVLVKEPFLLLRLPEDMLVNPALLRVVAHVTKAALLASRQSVRITTRAASQRASSGGKVGAPVTEMVYLEVQELIIYRLFVCLWEEEAARVCLQGESWWGREVADSVYGFLEWMIGGNEVLPAKQLYRSLLRHGLSEAAFKLLSSRSGTAALLEVLLLETVSRVVETDMTLAAYETIISHLLYQIIYRDGHSVTAKIAEKLPFYLYDNFRIFNNYLREADTDGVVDKTRKILHHLASSSHAPLVLPELVRIVAIPVKKGHNEDKRLVRKFLETAKELLAEIAPPQQHHASSSSGIVVASDTVSKSSKPVDLTEDWKLMQRAVDVAKPAYTNISKGATAKVRKAAGATSANFDKAAGANKRKLSSITKQ